MKLTNPKLFREQCYINGEWQGGTGTTIAVTDPATGDTIANVPNLGATETDAAIAHADAAFPAWRSLLAKERGAILRKWYELMLEHQEDLAQIITAEQGKTIAEARGEVMYSASFFEWYAEEARRIYGETIPQHQADKRLMVLKQPIGVCVAIAPWNFPAAMIARKVAPALAVGCTMVVKPDSQTPLSALALGELAEQAGVPRGVFSVVTGDAPPIGKAMTSNPLVRHLSFTGSTAVGKLLMKQCSDSVIKVSLELGGNAPLIVFDDADLDVAVAGAVTSKYRNSGQTCICTNRMYIQDKIYDAFAEKFAAAVAKIKVGDGRDADVAQGPMINPAAVEKVEAHIADAVSKGAVVACGGARHELGGTYFQPTVLTGVTQKMKVASEETFGPTAPLFRFSDEAEAIQMANDTEFGLASYFYTRDIARTWRVAEALDYGMVGINTGILSTTEAPFGGYKQSGIGREGGRAGAEEYLEVKYVCIGEVS